MFLIYFPRMKLLFKACLSPLVIPAIQPYLKTKFICVTPWVIHPVPLKSDAYMNRKHDALPLWTACELLRLRGDPSFVVVLPVLLSLSKHFSSALWFPSLCVWVCFILVLRKRVASTVQAGGWSAMRTEGMAFIVARRPKTTGLSSVECRHNCPLNGPFPPLPPSYSSYFNR